jgi:hypothetical protein
MEHGRISQFLLVYNSALGGGGDVDTAITLKPLHVHCIDYNLCYLISWCACGGGAVKTSLVTACLESKLRNSPLRLIM